MKRQITAIAVAALGLGLAGCASDPYHDRYAYGTPSYVTGSAPVYSNGNYSDWGRVVAIDVVRSGGSSGTAGAIVGGIVGGVLGHQIGSGRGNDVATAAGAIGGAVAGHELAKRRDGERFRVIVRMRDGREQAFETDHIGDIRVGDRVRFDSNGRLYRD